MIFLKKEKFTWTSFNFSEQDKTQVRREDRPKSAWVRPKSGEKPGNSAQKWA